MKITFTVDHADTAEVNAAIKFLRALLPDERKGGNTPAAPVAPPPSHADNQPQPEVKITAAAANGSETEELLAVVARLAKLNATEEARALKLRLGIQGLLSQLTPADAAKYLPEFSALLERLQNK